MRMTKVIADIGSCHMAKKEYCKEAIDLAVETKCWAIKFQLFKDPKPNIPLPREWWGELVEYAKDRIIIFASVFDNEALELLRQYKSPYIKFPYPMRNQYLAMGEASKFSKVIVSCGPQDLEGHYKGFIKLFCIPEYPVLYKVDFDIIKQYGFNGFSDHTIGWYQTFEAISTGAEYIEKHITLDHKDINCPDNKFALKPAELTEMMSSLWSLEKKTSFG